MNDEMMISLTVIQFSFVSIVAVTTDSEEWPCRHPSFAHSRGLLQKESYFEEDSSDQRRHDVYLGHTCQDPYIVAPDRPIEARKESAHFHTFPYGRFDHIGCQGLNGSLQKTQMVLDQDAAILVTPCDTLCHLELSREHFAMQGTADETRAEDTEVPMEKLDIGRVE